MAVHRVLTRIRSGKEARVNAIVYLIGKEQTGQCLYNNICDGHASKQGGEDHLQRWFEGTETIQIKFQIPNDVSGVRCS